MNTRSLLTRIAAITGIAVGAFAFMATASTWTAPTAAAPSGNVPAPINVGPNTDSSNNPLTQVKSDALVIQGLLGLSSLQFNPAGASNVAVGSTLTASDNKGDVQWTPPGTAAVECGADGFMYSRTNSNIDDWDTVAHGDFIEFYCRNHTVRICLSGDPSCNWRTNIAGDDSHTCNYSAGRLSAGVGSNSWGEWRAAPPSLCPADGGGKCTNSGNFNTGRTVMAYAVGSNTWYICSTAHQKTILTSY